MLVHFLTLLVPHTKRLSYELASRRVGTEDCTSNVQSTINHLIVHDPSVHFQPYLLERIIATSKVLCWEHMIAPRLPEVVLQ